MPPNGRNAYAWHISENRADLFLGYCTSAISEGLFGNPLVSPDVLEVSVGAGLGALLGIFFGLPLALIEGLAVTGGLATVAIVYAVAASVRC